VNKTFIKKCLTDPNFLNGGVYGGKKSGNSNVNLAPNYCRNDDLTKLNTYGSPLSR